jgi:hypothetical protein
MKYMVVYITSKGLNFNEQPQIPYFPLWLIQKRAVLSRYESPRSIPVFIQLCSNFS